MFGYFKKKPEVKGKIGYFGLQDWWLSAFTQQERSHIEEVFHPLGSNPDAKPLTEGEISWSSGTAPGLLHALAGWFNNPRDREVAKKIIAKAYELAIQGDDVLDHHFTLQQIIQIYYRERETSTEALDTAIKACREQIALAPKAAKAFLKEFPQQPLPSHVGYSQLRIIWEKQGKYDEAIELCELAKHQGWNGNWSKQIETLIKKKSRMR